MFNIETKVLAFIAAGVFTLAILTGLVFWGRDMGIKHDAKRTAPIIKQLGDDLKLCNANVDTLTSSLERQNSAVDQLRTESDERTRRAQEAIRQAQVQADTYRAKADRLARAAPGADMCESARELIITSLQEDR